MLNKTRVFIDFLIYDAQLQIKVMAEKKKMLHPEFKSLNHKTNVYAINHLNNLMYDKEMIMTPHHNTSKRKQKTGKQIGSPWIMW